MKIHIIHTGEVCVSPALPYGGANCSIVKASGVFTRKKDRLWLPVTCYLIEYDNKKILVDCGWHREMSPNGTFDTKAQIKSLGSPMLYKVNQGVVGIGQTIDEKLAARNVKDTDLDTVLLTHLDCDHANGLRLVKNAKRILIAEEERAFTKKPGTNLIRYCKKWWETVNVTFFQWNGTEGPAKKSYDVFGDGRIQMVNIPGHSDGQCAVKVYNEKGEYVLLFADGGYSAKSWKEQIVSGIADDREMQKKSLQWIAEQSIDKNCIASFASHDPEVQEQVVEF